MGSTRTKDIKGKSFGRLKVVRRVGKNRFNGALWLCRCKCNKEKIVCSNALRSGNTRSCGCLLGDTLRKLAKTRIPRIKHGMWNTPVWNAWNSAKSRCISEGNKNYSSYGGRGIQMCDRWLNSFENFYADMGPKPSSKHSLDRIDVNGDYKPSNCRWATALTQNNNRRRYTTLDKFSDKDLMAEIWRRTPEYGLEAC